MVVRRKTEKSAIDTDDSKGAFRVRDKESSFQESKTDGHQQSSHRKDIIFWIAVAISQSVGLTCVILVAYWCTLYGGFAWNSDADQQFFVHPLLMVFGLIFFYGDAILVYRILYFLPKRILKWIHAFLHVIAIILSSVGLIAVFENHRRTNKADLYSLHSWVGLATFSFFCLQYLGSFITFLFPGLPLRLRAKIMPFHTFFGVGIFILAVATAEMGLTERLIWTANYTSGNYVKKGTVGNVLGLYLIIFAFLVVFIATRSMYKRKPLPTDVAAPAN